MIYTVNRILLFLLLVIKTTTNCEQDVYFVINMKLVVRLLLSVGGGVKYKSLRRFAWSGHWGPKTQIHQNFWVGTSFKVCNPPP